MIEIKFIRKKENLATINVPTAEEVAPAIENKLAGYLNAEYRKGIKTQVSIIGETLGGTQYCNSDYYPVTIHKIADNGKTIWFSHDHYAFNKDTHGQFDYSNENAANPAVWGTMKLKKTGKFQLASYAGITTGHRKYYQNPEF